MRHGVLPPGTARARSALSTALFCWQTLLAFSPKMTGALPLLPPPSPQTPKKQLPGEKRSQLLLFPLGDNTGLFPRQHGLRSLSVNHVCLIAGREGLWTPAVPPEELAGVLREQFRLLSCVARMKAMMNRCSVRLPLPPEGRGLEDVHHCRARSALDCCCSAWRDSLVYFLSSSAFFLATTRASISFWSGRGTYATYCGACSGPSSVSGIPPATPASASFRSLSCASHSATAYTHPREPLWSAVRSGLKRGFGPWCGS
jgi:hypothetical protein